MTDVKLEKVPKGGMDSTAVSISRYVIDTLVLSRSMKTADGSGCSTTTTKNTVTYTLVQLIASMTEAL